MSVESVEILEAECALTPEEIAVLKSVRLVWQRLQAARMKAVKDDKAFPAYRDLLLKSAASTRQRMAPADPEVVEQQGIAFAAWYDQECEQRSITEIESRRQPLGHMAWAAKWLPVRYEAFQAALAAYTALPSALHLDALKVEALAMLTAYTGLFDGP